LSLSGGGPFRVGAGQITDDSELAMSILWGLQPDGDNGFHDPYEFQADDIYESKEKKLSFDLKGLQ
jgi:hypothetical protein